MADDFEIMSNGTTEKCSESKMIRNGSIKKFKNRMIKEKGNVIHDINENVESPELKKMEKRKLESLDTKPAKIIPAENLYTWKADGSVKIRDSFEEYAEPVTIPMMLKQQSQRLTTRPALAYKQDGKWKFVTYSEYYQNVRTAAKAFLKLGLGRFKSVCILGTNAPEWFYSDLAAMMAGGFAVGIYTTNLPDACLHCLKSSNANIVVVENDVQLQKILQVKNQVPDLKAIIQYTGVPSDPSVLTWEEMMEIGRQEPDVKVDQIMDDLAANQCCSILFTSGTTSAPKAVMLSHDNLIFDAKMIIKYLNLGIDYERYMSYLPLSHAAAQIGDLFIGFMSGACVYFADKTVLKGGMIANLKEVKPTALFGVPRVWEKIKEGLETVEKSSSYFSQFVASSAKAVALNHYKALSKGCVEESYAYRFFKYLVYNRVKQTLGLEHNRVFLSGAAPISSEVREYLTSFDMPVAQAFGMSECSGAHTQTNSSDTDFHSCGLTLPGMRTKIDKPDEDGFGEVCLYGRNVFMGYLNDPENTKEAIDSEGWLHSGDLGKINSKSFLQITGRIKDLLITAGGENIAPILIEQTVKTELPMVSQAVIIAESRKYVTLLITLKSKVDLENGIPLDELAPETRAWCQSLDCDYNTVSEILKVKPLQLYNSIRLGIDRVNDKAVSQAQKIQKFTILPRDFSILTGELGPTLKLKRRVVYERYHDQIEDMYSN